MLPTDYKKTRAHFTFDVKHGRRHEARLVTSGNLTEAPLSNTQSSAVLLRGIESWGTYVGNPCLEAYTKEKTCIIAGPEFGGPARSFPPNSESPIWTENFRPAVA